MKAIGNAPGAAARPGETAAGPAASPRKPHGSDHAGSPAATALRNRQRLQPLYGALDLGTNNCRLLIAGPAEQGFRVVDAFSRIVRLGQGASRNGHLSEAAMERTVKAVRVCANKLRWWQVSRARLIATEACRMATNGSQFIERVGTETGIELEVIDRETEARLAVAGVAPLIDGGARSVVIFDIGGGSTELMWVDAGGAQVEIVAWTSLPMGVVTLAEEFGGRDVDETCYTAMRTRVRPLLELFAGEVALRAGLADGPDHLLGTSGTVTTIAGLHAGLARYDRSKVDGSWLSRQAITAVTRQLLAMDYEARAASPCIGRERADLVLAGCAIFDEIRSTWPCERVRVADRGLREGLLAMMMREDGTYGRAARQGQG